MTVNGRLIFVRCTVAGRELAKRRSSKVAKRQDSAAGTSTLTLLSSGPGEHKQVIRRTTAILALQDYPPFKSNY